MPLREDEFRWWNPPADCPGPLPPIGTVVEIDSGALRRLGLHPRQQSGFDVAHLGISEPWPSERFPWGQIEVTAAHWCWHGVVDKHGSARSYRTGYDWWGLYSTPCADRPTVADNESAEWPFSIYQ